MTLPKPDSSYPNRIRWSAELVLPLIDTGNTSRWIARRLGCDFITAKRNIQKLGLWDRHLIAKRDAHREHNFQVWRTSRIMHPRKPGDTPRYHDVEQWIDFFKQAIAGGFDVDVRCRPFWSTIEGAHIRLSRHQGRWVVKVPPQRGRKPTTKVYRYMVVQVGRPMMFNVIKMPNGQWLFLLPVVAKPDQVRLRPAEVMEARWWPTPDELAEAVARVKKHIERRQR